MMEKILKEENLFRRRNDNWVLLMITGENLEATHEKIKNEENEWNQMMETEAVKALLEELIFK